jgi:hypothetical protein
VVFGGDDKMTHAGVPRLADPVVGVEPDWVETAGHLGAVFGYR